MAKVINSILILCCLFPWNNPNQSQCLKCLVSTYHKEVGVREVGWNAGKRVEEYLASVGLPKGQPWCAAFVAYCHLQCMIPHPRSGYSPDWFRSPIPLKMARQGDVFGIYFPSKGRIAHVGFIDKIKINQVFTVEGNTGPDVHGVNREGDGVYCKIRMRSQIYRVSRWVKDK